MDSMVFHLSARATFAVFIVAVVTTAGVVGGITYLSMAKSGPVYRPMNELYWTVNCTLFSWGASQAANVSSVVLMTVKIRKTDADNFISNKTFQQSFIGNISGINTDYLSKGEAPVNGTLVYSDSDAVFIIQFNIALEWANLTNSTYVVRVASYVFSGVGNDSTPADVQKAISEILIENATTYSLVYGGLHYDPSLNGGNGDVDYAAVNLNGTDVHIPVEASG